jgi:hypothetical protein
VIPAQLIAPALGAAAVAGVVLWVQFVFVPNIRAEQAREIAAATAVAVAEYQVAALQASEAAAKAQRERDAARLAIREKIIRVPIKTACADSPAVAVALDGLRRPAGDRGASSAGQPVDVPGGAGTAARP